LDGDLALIRKLNTLKSTTAKSAIRKGTRAGAKITQAAARRLAPVRSGALRKGLKVRSLPRSRRWVGTTLRLTSFYVKFIEYGTKKMEGKRFLRAAVEESKDQALATTIELIRQDTIGEDAGPLRVWFQRSSHEEELDLDGTPGGLHETSFNLEVSGLDIDVVQQTGDVIAHALHGYMGLMSSERVLGAIVESVSDDYIPRSADADEGYHIAAYSVRIIHL
jgi:HK97 gp10 family phage protein